MQTSDYLIIKKKNKGVGNKGLIEKKVKKTKVRKMRETKGLKCLIRPRALNGEFEETELIAWWEVDCSCISQNFTPEETSARAMFYRWADVVKREYPEGLIPIFWGINLVNRGPERFPLRWEPEPFVFTTSNMHCLFSYFSYPLTLDTKKPINFMEVPVKNVCWRKGEISACSGFIQEYTGWKPSILQPYIHLPALENFAKLREQVEESGKDLLDEEEFCLSNRLTSGWHDRLNEWKEKRMIIEERRKIKA